MKQYNNEKVIVSLTSHGERLKIAAKAIFSILNGIEKSVHIVLTLYKDDINKIPEDIKLFIDGNFIELLIADENLKPHLKYYYVMKKYKAVPIITIDDDCIYSKDLVSSLLNCYNKHSNSICARRIHEIKNTKYRNWKYEISYNNISKYKKLATGVGGVIYPPNILDIDNIDINEIKQCLLADDIFLKAIENRKNIDIQLVANNQKHPLQEKSQIILRTALSNANVLNNKNDLYVKRFYKDIYK